MKTAQMTEQLELNLVLGSKDEAFIAGFKQGWVSSQNSNYATPTVDQVFDALHTWQKSPSGTLGK